MFDDKDIEVAADQAETWLDRAERGDLLDIFAEDKLTVRGLQNLIGAMTRQGYPYDADLGGVLLPLLQHENKYVFLGTLQYLLRAHWTSRVEYLASLPIPDTRSSLAQSLLQVLEEVRR